MSRYTSVFSALAARHEGAFVPFVMLGDPDPETNVAIISALIDAGADALELGLPFSDPVADGPTIQAADIRAFDAGTTFDTALTTISRIRSKHPDIPIGLLCYANIAFCRGIDDFYTAIAKAGADSVLIPDVPMRESTPFREAAQRRGVDAVFIAPPNVNTETVEQLAKNSQGYIYAVSRLGVTGAESASQNLGLKDIVARVRQFDGPPVLLGFGISTPEHVASAIAAGAAGAITGSAIASIIEKYCAGEHPEPRQVTDVSALLSELHEYVSAMKAATRPEPRR